MRRVLLAVGSALLLAVALLATPAAAAPKYDPNVTRVANPGQACRSIPLSAQNAGAVLGMPVDVSSFDLAGCVRTLAQRAAVVPGLGSPYDQCDVLVNIGAVTYPMVLHAGEAGDEDAFLPDLLVRDRTECGNALYAYHSIGTLLFGEH